RPRPAHDPVLDDGEAPFNEGRVAGRRWSMTVAVYGATGWTAAHVIAALQRDRVPLLLSGRDQSKLAAVADGLAGRVCVRPAALDDPASIARMLDGVRLVVNCAGPFVESGT